VGQLPSLGVSSKSRYRLRGTCNRCGMPQDLATDPLVSAVLPMHESSRIFRTDVRYASSALTSGMAKGSQPFAWGVGLCPTSLSPRVACGDARKRGFCGDTPPPGRDAALPAPSLFRIFVSKIRDDSCPCKFPLETGREWWEDEREEYGDVSWKGSDHDGNEGAALRSAY